MERVSCNSGRAPETGTRSGPDFFRRSFACRLFFCPDDWISLWERKLKSKYSTMARLQMIREGGCGWPRKLDNLTWCKKPVKLT
ncbi:MAG TPA: hypothetical protein DE060_00145 [Lentisphaeria bacterium]|nr:hypothetical protein [Lentisphaeria bacterium]HCG47597.1 hypothetical protein [Lentisphaeria bacterium]